MCCCPSFGFERRQHVSTYLGCKSNHILYIVVQVLTEKETTQKTKPIQAKQQQHNIDDEMQRIIKVKRETECYNKKVHEKNKGKKNGHERIAGGKTVRVRTRNR